MSGDYHIANHTQAQNDARVKILEEKAIEQRTDSESDACECVECTCDRWGTDGEDWVCECEADQ
jgi:hypothetical protein